MSRVAPWWDLAAVLCAKTALSGCVLLAGFVALSDDDFSRVVIAEQFAHAPSFDPSGTSWLPLPFWIHGASMMAFGRSLATAHATAVALGVLSAMCIHRAALWLGVSRLGAVLSALLATGIPTAARLGVSTQPEALAAGLVMLGAASTGVDGSRRVAGAVALFAACLCRYEAWAAAAVFACLTGYDGVASGAGARRRTLFAAALVSVLGPFAWIVHGAASHGDTLFFLHRVAAYRRALGVTEPFVQSLVAYPVALLRGEPELTLSALLLLPILARRAPLGLARLSRPALVVGGLFVFLIVGRVLDGAPTHHAERTLLPVWTLLAVLVAEGVVRSLSPVGRELGRARVLRLSPFCVAVLLVSVLLRAGKVPEPDASRRPESDIGHAARARLAPDDTLLVDTADYGYFAVIAAFGAPERAMTVDRHDPREPRPDDVFATDERLLSLLRSTRARWLSVPGTHLPAALRLGTVVATAQDFSLVHRTLP